MSPAHRRPDGIKQIGPTWESLVERQIREAMADGAFDDLPHQGGPLPLDDDAAAGEWAMAYRMLKDAGVAPPWIEADKEARVWLARRDELLEGASDHGPAGATRARREFVTVVEAANQAIDRLNAEAPTSAQHRRRLDPAAELEVFDRRSRRTG